MTLVIAAPGKNFVVIGYDSRGILQDTAGTRIERNDMEKMIRIADHVCVLMYGNGDIGNEFVEKFKSNLSTGTDGVTKIADDFAEFCREKIKVIKDVPYESFPNLGFVVAGLDEEEGTYKTPRTYYLESTYAFMLAHPPYVIKGKKVIAEYIFVKTYKKDAELDDLCSLVAQSIYDTMSVDGDVGGDIKMGIIRSDGLTEVPAADISGWLKPEKLIT